MRKKQLKLTLRTYVVFLASFRLNVELETRRTVVVEDFLVFCIQEHTKVVLVTVGVQVDVEAVATVANLSNVLSLHLRCVDHLIETATDVVALDFVVEVARFYFDVKEETVRTNVLLNFWHSRARRQAKIVFGAFGIEIGICFFFKIIFNTNQSPEKNKRRVRNTYNNRRHSDILALWVWAEILENLAAAHSLRC